MAIKVIIGQSDQAAEPKKIVQATTSLDIRRMLDGSIVIFDHEDMDIVIQPHLNKIVAFPKEEISDDVYDSENRLFKFLTTKGVLELGSIQGGHVFASLEATIPDKNKALADPVQAAVLNIAKFIEDEKPFFRRDDEYEEDVEEMYLEPDEEDSTELGEVPHHPKKGTVNRWPGSNANFAFSGMMRE